MNQQHGMNSNIQVGQRELHVQTAFSRTTSKIISNVFEDGRVIETREEPVRGNVEDKKLQKRIEQFHQNTLKDIELLFFIAEKVRQVKHALSCNKLGLVFLKRGFLKEAIEFFTLALQTDPKFVEAYNNLGLALVQEGQLDRAEEFFKKGLDIESGYADLHLNLAMLHYKRKQYPAAVQSAQAALGINPTYYDAHVYKGLALLRSLAEKVTHEELPPLPARGKEAMDHLERAAQLFKPMNNEAFRQGKTAYAAEDFESAVKYFEKAYEEANQKMDMTFDHEFYLKFMYGGKGKDNQFIGGYVEQLKEAIKNYPEFADLHNNLGIAYLIMCRNLFLKALDEFRLALKINPKFKKAEKNLKLAENDGKGFLILLRALLK